MAVTVTSRLTTLDECDVTDDWGTTGGAGGLEANSDFERTGSACIGAKVSNEEGGVELTFPGGARNMVGEHIIVWMQATLELDPVGTGMRILISDSSNTNEYAVANSITYLGGWQVFVLDCDATPTVDNSVNIGAVLRIGFEMDTATAVTGNISSFFVDKVSVQPAAQAYAIEVTGGLTGDRGTWAEIIADSVNDEIGVVERRSGIVVLNAPIKFGTTTSADTFFEDANEVCVFQNHFVEDEYFGLTGVGNSGQTNSFVLGTEVGSGDDSRGTGGGLIKTAGASFHLTFIDTDIIVDFWGVTIDGAGNTRWEQTNAQAVSCTWTNSGRITHDNNAEMREGVISSSTTVSPAGAIEFLQNPVTPDFRDMAIINCVFGIEWDTDGTNTLDLRGVSFAGNTDDLRFNHNTGLLTVNVLENSDTPSTSDGGEGGTVSVIASNPVTITVLDAADNSVIVGAEVFVEENDGSEIVSGTTNGSGVFSDTTSFNGAMVFKIRKSTSGTKYIAIRRTGTIAAGTGFIAEVLMVEDTIA